MARSIRPWPRDIYASAKRCRPTTLSGTVVDWRLGSLDMVNAGTDRIAANYASYSMHKIALNKPIYSVHSLLSKFLIMNQNDDAEARGYRECELCLISLESAVTCKASQILYRGSFCRGINI
jgi:hypothetical protein